MLRVLFVEKVFLTNVKERDKLASKNTQGQVVIQCICVAKDSC